MSQAGLFQQFEHAPRQHAGLLLSQIEIVMGEAKVEKHELAAIAVCHGPGSFTGIRVAVAMAQGLGFALDCPVLPISSLAAMAQGAFRKYGAKHVAVVVDARMKEVYWAGYEMVDQQIPVPLIEPQLSSPQEVSFLADRSWVGIGDGWNSYSAELAINTSLDTIFSDDLFEAQDLLPLALSKLEQGERCLPGQLRPYYLRESVTK